MKKSKKLFLFRQYWESEMKSIIKFQVIAYTFMMHEFH